MYVSVHIWHGFVYLLLCCTSFKYLNSSTFWKRRPWERKSNSTEGKARFNFEISTSRKHKHKDINTHAQWDTMLEKQDGNLLKSLNSSVYACTYFTSVPTSVISISLCEIDVRASTREREMFLFLQVWTRLKVLTVRTSTRLLCQACFSKRRETTNISLKK